MLSWYLLSLISLLCFGAQGFLYKVVAERDYNTLLATFTFMLTVSIVSSALFFIAGQKLIKPFYLLLISFLNGVSFFIGTVASMEALKKVPANIFYPIYRSRIALTVLFSIFYFQESLTLFNVIGIILSLIVAVILGSAREQEKEDGKIKRGFILVIIALLGGTVASITSKFAAGSVNQLSFIALSYIINTFFSVASEKKIRGVDISGEDDIKGLLIGVGIGILNFLGFYAFLQGLKVGPLSLIATISGLQFVIVIILSIIVYEEKVTLKRALGIILAILATILLKRW